MGRSTKVNSRRRGVTTVLAALGLAAQESAAFTLPAAGVRGRRLWASAVETGTVGDAVFKKGKVVNPDHDILLRVARGEDAHRTPVWLMRQAGRYMKAFRAFSTKYGFRQRSETPSMAIELSLQPLEAFGVDGVVFFSDILTPLPALGIEFDVVPGKGPIIPQPIRNAHDVDRVRPLVDPQSSLPFIEETLRTLRKETEGRATLLGFVGAPFTLAAYSIEGGSSKECKTVKHMMMYDPAVLSTYLDKLATAIGHYANYQIESGAQVIQIFESWAHQLSPVQFLAFSKPYAEKVTAIIKEKHPEVPVIFFGHGASSFLELQKDMSADMICIDWRVDMAAARGILGQKPVSGNVDPTVLLGPSEGIVSAVDDCIRKAGGHSHILNVGHGVTKETPEDAVKLFVDTAQSISLETVRGQGKKVPPRGGTNSQAVELVTISKDKAPLPRVEGGRMVQPEASLVKYDTPILLSSGKPEKKGKGKHGATGAGDGKGSSPTEDILNSILPPREWTDKGQVWVQYVSSTPATRLDVITLQENLDRRLQEQQARETGICSIREKLYSQCFDELIRQVTINCAERGLLLLRVRDEIRMTMGAYQTLYESSIAFGIRKALVAEQKKAKMEAKIQALEQEKEELEEQVQELTNKCLLTEKREAERREGDERKHAEEVEKIKKNNDQLKTTLETLLSAPNS